MRNREFYKKVLEALDSRGSVCIQTCLEGEQKGEKHIREDGCLTGSEEVYTEILYRQPKALILGAGHVSQALAKILLLLDFQVTVADSRKEFANSVRFPGAQVVCEDFGTYLDSLAQGNYDYYIIVTRGHKDDDLCLRRVLKKRYEYVGMIGSRKKVALCLENLRKAGFTEEKIRDIHAPIGLDIGAQTPGEIAVSIGAQIIQLKSKEPKSILETSVMQEIPVPGEKVLVTVIEKKGSSPRGEGSRMIVDLKGGICGTIGGGAVEGAAIAFAKSMKEDFALQEYDLSNTQAAGLGMVCGGKVKVMFEKL